MFIVDSKTALRESLIKLTECPSIFIGAERLDYLLTFSAGWDMVTSVYSWAADHEIQEWIFSRESVSIANAASSHGTSLISYCYGNSNDAIAKYNTLLKDVAFKSKKDMIQKGTVSQLIYGIASSLENDISCFFHEWAPITLRQAAKEITRSNLRTYEGIIPIINHIIGEPCDDINVFLCFSNHFLCVKFLYYTEKGEWKECSSLINSNDHFKNLIILHAFITLVKDKKHNNHIITLRNKRNKITIKYEKMQTSGDTSLEYSNNDSICTLFTKWKKILLSHI